MKYLPEENTLNIPEDFEQAFYKDPFLTTDLTATVMLKTKGIIDKTDIKIIYYIYDTKFCTKGQLVRWANYVGIEEDELWDRLDVMLKNTIINKFGLVDEEKYKGALPDDAKMFFCLHDGGKNLLDNFSGEDFIDWQAGYNVTHPKNVLKSLISAELYTQFFTSESPLLFHERRPLYTLKMDRFFGGDVFSVLKNGETHYYVCDIFLSSDKTNTVRNKLRNYENVFCSQIWKRYYKACGFNPHLIFITDDDAAAAVLASEVSNFRFNDFLISTKDRVLSGVNTQGSFLKLNKDMNQLELTSLGV